MAARFLSAKDVQYDRPGSVASFYGWNERNIDNAIKSRITGDSKNAANVRSHIDKYLSKRNTTLDTANAQQRIDALDYSYREESRKQQTKGSFFDKIAGFIGPAVGILTGNPWLGALAGATSNVAAGKGLKGAALGAVSGGASGYFSPGAGSILKGGSGAAASSGGGFVNANALGIAGSGAAPTTFSAAGPFSTLASSLYSPAALAQGAGTGFSILGAAKNAANSTAGKVASTANSGKSIYDKLKDNAPLIASGASALASVIGAKAGAASVKPATQTPRKAAPVSTASSKVVDINDARVRKAALDQTTAASDGFGFDDTKNTGARGILTPARTRKKQLLGA